MPNEAGAMPNASKDASRLGSAGRHEHAVSLGSACWLWWVATTRARAECQADRLTGEEGSKCHGRVRWNEVEARRRCPGKLRCTVQDGLLYSECLGQLEFKHSSKKHINSGSSGPGLEPTAYAECCMSVCICE